MGVKPLTLTEEAYRRLRAQKRRAESFSDVILRLTARPPLAGFAGILPGTSAKRLKGTVEDDRRLRAAADGRTFQWD